jgi:hypothetical protein
MEAKSRKICKSFSGLTLATGRVDNLGMEWKVRLAKAGMAGGSILIGLAVIYTVLTATDSWTHQYPSLEPWFTMIDLAAVIGGVALGGMIYNWGRDQIDP